MLTKQLVLDYVNKIDLLNRIKRLKSKDVFCYHMTPTCPTILRVSQGSTQQQSNYFLGHSKSFLKLLNNNWRHPSLSELNPY